LCQVPVGRANQLRKAASCSPQRKDRDLNEAYGNILGALEEAKECAEAKKNRKRGDSRTEKRGVERTFNLNRGKRRLGSWGLFMKKARFVIHKLAVENRRKAYQKKVRGRKSSRKPEDSVK